jgi:uncharacterized protein
VRQDTVNPFQIDAALPEKERAMRCDGTRRDDGGSKSIGSRVAELDPTGRLAGTMRVTEMLSKGVRIPGAWVHGEAWRVVPESGLFVIVEKSSVGLLPNEEPHTLKRGDAARFRVSHVRADGKIELSLRAHAHEELEGDAARVLSVLAAPGAAPVSERASPEELRARFA